MKIAVTGATGFIGGHVLADLAARDIEVVAACRQATAAFPAMPGLKTVALDIADSDERSFDLLGRPDALIHLAWGGLPNYRSLHHFETELPQQYRFLSTLVGSGLEGLVVAGTCFEYGMQSGELSETLEPRPDNPYGFAKDALRRQLEFLRQTNPFALSWGRLFYLYGEGQSPTSLLPLLRCAVEQGEPTFNMSGGEQLRDYLPASDVARHLVDLVVGKADIGVVNISSGKPISIRKLVEGWIAENGWDVTPNYGFYPYPDYEPMAFWGDCRKLQRASGTI